MLQHDVGQEFYFHAKFGMILEYRDAFIPSFTVLGASHELAKAVMSASEKYEQAGKQADWRNLTMSPLHPLMQMTHPKRYCKYCSHNLAIIR